MMPTDYLAQFAHLHTAVSRSHWSAATRHRAPNKPLLLLAVLDSAAQGTLTANLIEPTPDLGDLFAGYWACVMPAERRGNLAMPFFHLRADGFWHLVAKPGKEPVVAALKTMTSLAQVRDLLLGARLDDDLFLALHDPAMRELLRGVLIETYFAPELHEQLLAQGKTNVASFAYARTLIEAARASRPIKEEEAEAPYTPVRDQGFRRAVVGAYDHRCAFCGIRMFTSDGHTAVEAAHIIPWAVAHNDDPRNGLALCRLCHWAFDEGLLGVTGRYTLLAAAQLSLAPNLPGHLAPLQGRAIFLPDEEPLQPDKAALAWHRNKRMG